MRNGGNITKGKIIRTQIIGMAEYVNLGYA